jgi:hypothetical protein
MQGEQPVTYTSRALNAAERKYAQIEKEILRKVYGLQIFNEYVYRKTVSEETDHKLLESLFWTEKNPTLSSAPTQLQRVMLKVFINSMTCLLSTKPARNSSLRTHC